MVGRYRILRVLGRGGMGEVYLAQQEEPVNRRVALKLVKLGMDTREVVARFESERQALALMDHPGIAKVFDGGASESGRPYFVMELVHGVALTAYCDQHRLTIRQRLDLLLQLCDAVQHAHQKGVIHRDLKPSNILVSDSNGQAVPKIIDFGVAKATNPRLLRQATLTAYGQFIGTPEYMSPEQADSAGAEVDTRSDIYSLGVILYELLTGTLPYDRERLRSSSIEEMCRIIRESDAPKPSTRVGSLDDDSSASAHRRRTDPKSLSRCLRGDLDWILLRALDKDPTRRYGTASALADDIRRHLGDEPVAAGPPKTSYRLGKFARRHRRWLVAAGAVILALLAGLVSSTVLFLRERETAEKAKIISRFLRDTLSSADPAVVGKDVGILEVLKNAERDIQYVDSPEVEATLRQILGRTYYSLGSYDAAERHLRAALTTRRKALGEQHYETLESRVAIGQLLMAQQKGKEGLAFDKETLAMCRSALGEHDRLTLQVKLNVGRLSSPQEAERLYRSIAELDQDLLPENDLTWRAVALDDLGVSFLIQRRLDEAEKVLFEALRIRTQRHGELHIDTVTSIYHCSRLRELQGRVYEALELQQRNAELEAKIYSDDHPHLLFNRAAMGGSLRLLGRLAEAEKIGRDVLEASRRRLGEGHPRTMERLYLLALVLYEQGRLDEAERGLRTALSGLHKTVGSSHRHSLMTASALAELLRARGAYAESEELFKETLALFETALGADHPLRLIALNSFANLQRDQGNLAQAEERGRHVVEAAREVLPKEHWMRAVYERDYATTLAKLERFDEAESLFLQALALLEGVFGRDHPETQRTSEELVDLYTRWNRPDALEKYRAVLSQPPP